MDFLWDTSETVQRERDMASTPDHRASTLATIAFFVLDARGLSTDPTLHDIALAVVQAAPLLNLTYEINAPEIEIAAILELAQRHGWLRPSERQHPAGLRGQGVEGLIECDARHPNLVHASRA